MPTASAVGLGLRRALIPELLAAEPAPFDFLECAPDNWVGVGGAAAEQLRTLSRRHPLTCHGLSLSLGGVAPLDRDFLAATRRFLDTHAVALYSEHLSWCDDGAQLYELLPLPHSEEAVHHVAARIRQAQDVLGRRIAIENVSRYATPPAHGASMPEAEFVCAVLAEADCDLLLDVNNVQVNALNFGGDAAAFIAAMPSTRIACLHVAGHDDDASGLKVDTHARPVDDTVWQLLAHTYRCHGLRPTLLERDSRIPPLAELAAELQRIRQTGATLARAAA
ncbi:hypothetical protein ARC20_07280 [Stenotrophomonas panacihumi]|uniref:Uncharacterized protein n=1 Tax=Stenotrophomonas panacihumi TaxID=676599 RepID=A0A0R0AWQ8_9GAMM|nr:DUF692 domain-containing protein [Stenotrophomonas panacihumi]KRG45847.1 hypothetical protein ARC20_07280 [Stenotrophomonas panacihumi]PTN53400.1 DUF692 domain-containing protein [Stenotrophomonas panacihumi]